MDFVSNFDLNLAEEASGDSSNRNFLPESVVYNQAASCRHFRGDDFNFRKFSTSAHPDLLQDKRRKYRVERSVVQLVDFDGNKRQRG